MMILYGIVLTYVISQHHQTYTQGLELPQDRQGLPHDLRSLSTFSFPCIIIFEKVLNNYKRVHDQPGRFLAA